MDGCGPMAKALPASCRLAVSERNLNSPGGGRVGWYTFFTTSGNSVLGKTQGGRKIFTHSLSVYGETWPTTNEGGGGRPKKEQLSWMLRWDQQLPMKTKWVGQEEKDRARRTTSVPYSHFSFLSWQLLFPHILFTPLPWWKFASQSPE
jgi:hypothetical protein